MQISCCKDFTNPVLFGPHIEYGAIPFSAPTLLLHGYHSPEKEAESSYKEIEKHLDRGWLEYYWPGGAIAIDFPLAVERATMTGWRLRDILLRFSHGSYLNVETHSLGARPILEALKYKGLQIGHLILTAPAVNNACFDVGGEFEESPKWCRSVNIFYSNNDPVLRDTYPLSPTNFGKKALGLTGSYLKKLNGNDTNGSNIKEFDYSNIVNTHGGYRYLAQFYTDWKKIEDGR